MRLSRLPPLLTLLVLGTGCRALNRDRYRELLEANAPVDGGSESGTPCTPDTDGGVTESGCHLYTVPPRPSTPTDLAPDAGARVFAARRIIFGFGATNVWHTLGFDRDGFCTNPTTLPAQGCRPAAGVQPAEDGEGGRDDSFATQIGALFATQSFNEADANQSINAGTGTLGARVTSLGGADDPSVIVEWFPMRHGRAMDGTSTLRWDGTDLWAIDARLAYNPSSPGVALIRSTTGYTSCGTLVARLPSRMPIRFAGTRRATRLTLSGGLIGGPIDPAGASLGPLDFSAYWPVVDAQFDMGAFGLCPPTGDAGASPQWEFTSQVLVGSADMLSTGESSPAVDCDAISVAFRVEFGPITLGPDEMSPVVPDDLCVR